MKRIEVNIQTGERREIDLTAQEILDAQARAVAEAVERAEREAGRADLEHLDDKLKALAMVFAEITQTPLSTVRQMFRQKMESLK